MEEEKRKMIEAKFRKLLKYANQDEEKTLSPKHKLKEVRVIRRRKGSPDLQIA